MPSVKQPSNVGSITVAGTTLTPSGGRVVPASDLNATLIAHHTTRAYMVRSAANGDVVIKLPTIVTSITIGGNVYTPNGSNEITVPAVAATAYLEELKYSL